VRVPGVRSLAQAQTVGALLGGKEALKEDPYLLLGVLETEDPVTSARRYFALSLENIFRGLEDFKLRDDDRLIILGRDDVAYLSSAPVQEIIANSFGETDDQIQRLDARRDGDGAGGVQAANLGTLEQIAARVSAERAGQPVDESESLANERLQEGGPAGQRCQSLESLKKLASESRTGRFANAVIGKPNGSASRSRGEQSCRPLFENNAALLPFLIEHGAAISGEIRLPGIYPIAGDTSLASIVGVAGGVTREADFSRVNVSRFSVDAATGLADLSRLDINANDRSLSEIVIGPGDAVRFNPVFTDRDNGPVFLIGEFVRPGSYEIRRGERLSEVMARAGGPTAQAYPFGALFTRERVKRAEEASLRRLARELNSAVTVAAANRGIDASAVASFAELTRDVANVPASGRVVIEADPTVLQVRPELDIVLEPGDRVFMPKRPNSVLVTGDVLNPGAMQFVSGKSLDTYIRQAGGFQQSADRRRLFVIFPNGSAQPVSVSPFNYTPLRVPPGSAIVVPKDATPFDVFTITREVASLVSQLAITAASLAVISSN
jgi:protein involved in polysaccharide export with SLBB domain